MLLRTIILLLFYVLLSACSGHTENSEQPVDISKRFSLAMSPREKHEPLDVLTGRVTDLDFKPVILPRYIERTTRDLWLVASLSPEENDQKSKVLEIPGHLFARVDVWFSSADRPIVHQWAGTEYPYQYRTIKHAGIAFLVPESHKSQLNILLRLRARTSVNFSALLWDIEVWDAYLFKQRGWYGIFFGAILVLCFYNIFLAFTLRDKSYLYYVGYIISLAGVVVLYSGLAEEYLWPDGKTATYILMVSGFGIFFGVGFVNSFLRIKQRIPLLYWVTFAVSVLALIFGVLHAQRIYIVPISIRGTVMHVLLLLGCLYFIGVSFVSYLMGIKQSRFLALSMLALLSGMVIYLLYTYGFIKYNLSLLSR